MVDGGIILATLKIMVRPVKDEKERKDVDLRIPVTADQKELITKAAKLSNADMAAWARPVLLEHAEAIIAQGKRKGPDRKFGSKA